MKEINCKLVVEQKDYNGTKYNQYKLYVGEVWIIINPKDSTSKEILEDYLKTVN